MQELLIPNEYIDINQAVSLLGVSSATIRNWIKHNYITPEKTTSKNLLFNHKQLTYLKQKITSGEINRLNKRANKKSSSNTFIPDEYADTQEVIDLVQKILEEHRIHALERNGVILMIALNLLQREDLVKYESPFSFDTIIFRNTVVKTEINWWMGKVKSQNSNQNYLNLLYINLPKVSDILGLIYQSLFAEGNKAQAGSYYTPKAIVDKIVNEYVKKDFWVLDPCCGTGQFLLSASNKINNPNNLWGFDIDETAVRLARLNLLLRFSEIEFTPNIYHKNTLLDFESFEFFTENTTPTFDVVITNPPWGVHYSKAETDRLQNIFPSITSGEAFSYFLQKGLHLLKEGGILSFILPESILNIRTHKDIRKILVNQTSIKKVKYLDRIFKNVFTPVIQLDIEKIKPNITTQIEAEKEGKVYNIEQARLKCNPDYIFNVFTDDTDIALFDKVFNTEHITLKNNAEWALGIVTGDNNKYLIEGKRTNTSEPIITGKDVKKFLPNIAKFFIEFTPDKFQQVAPEMRYRAKEKLIYKFISKKLVFSYDDKQMLTLNSANILIPKIKDYPVKTILALFNSNLYQFLHHKKFDSLKVLRGDLEKLPLPDIFQKQHIEIEHFVNQLLEKDLDDYHRKKILNDLDNYIMNLFNLNEKEKEHIKNSINCSGKLLAVKFR